MLFVLVVDVRKKAVNITNGDCMVMVSGFRFLGVSIKKDLTWGTHTADEVKKAQKRLIPKCSQEKQNP